MDLTSKQREKALRKRETKEEKRLEGILREKERIISGKVKLSSESMHTERYSKINFKTEVAQKSGKARKSVKGVFLAETRRDRFTEWLSEAMVVSARPKKLIPHLLLDDRVACQYVDYTKSTGFGNLPGGYFRDFEEINGLVYLSPFDYPGEYYFNSNSPDKIHMIVWDIEKINRIYISRETEDRIKCKVLNTEMEGTKAALRAFAPTIPSLPRKKGKKKGASTLKARPASMLITRGNSLNI